MGMCAGGSAHRLPLNRALSFGSASQGRKHVGGDGYIGCATIDYKINRDIGVYDDGYDKRTAPPS